MAAYYVKYHVSGKEEQGICIGARNKADAYIKAFFEEIPKIEGELPYSAWVSSVTYQNGRCHYFNTSEGNAY